MRVDRLRIVAQVLERVIEKGRRFDMEAWTVQGWDELNSRIVYDDCGTAACAAGWTARSEEGQAEGLRLDPIGWPMFDEWRGLEAMAHWLEVGIHDASRLFLPEDDDLRVDEERVEVTPATVLERVRLLIDSPVLVA